MLICPGIRKHQPLIPSWIVRVNLLIVLNPQVFWPRLGLNRHSSMAEARPASALPQGVLEKADLQLGIQAFLQWDPELKAKKEFELENARECFFFLQLFLCRKQDQVNVA